MPADKEYPIGQTWPRSRRKAAIFLRAADSIPNSMARVRFGGLLVMFDHRLDARRNITTNGAPANTNWVLKFSTLTVMADRAAALKYVIPSWGHRTARQRFHAQADVLRTLVRLHVTSRSAGGRKAPLCAGEQICGLSRDVPLIIRRQSCKPQAAERRSQPVDISTRRLVPFTKRPSMLAFGRRRRLLSRIPFG